MKTARVETMKTMKEDTTKDKTSSKKRNKKSTKSRHDKSKESKSKRHDGKNKSTKTKKKRNKTPTNHAEHKQQILVGTMIDCDIIQSLSNDDQFEVVAVNESGSVDTPTTQPVLDDDDDDDDDIDSLTSRKVPSSLSSFTSRTKVVSHSDRMEPDEELRRKRSQLAFDAAKVGWRSRLKEHTVEALGMAEEGAQDTWQLKTSVAQVMLPENSTSIYMRCLQEAVLTGRIKQEYEHVEEPEWELTDLESSSSSSNDHEGASPTHRPSCLVEAVVMRQQLRKRHSWAPQNSVRRLMLGDQEQQRHSFFEETADASTILLSPKVPEFRKRIVDKRPEVNRSLADEVVEAAVNRAMRIVTVDELRVRESCKCSHCKNPSSYPTRPMHPKLRVSQLLEMNVPTDYDDCKEEIGCDQNVRVLPIQQVPQVATPKLDHQHLAKKAQVMVVHDFVEKTQEQQLQVQAVEHNPKLKSNCASSSCIHASPRQTRKYRDFSKSPTAPRRTLSLQGTSTDAKTLFPPRTFQLRRKNKEAIMRPPLAASPSPQEQPKRQRKTKLGGAFPSWMTRPLRRSASVSQLQLHRRVEEEPDVRLYHVREKRACSLNAPSVPPPPPPPLL